MSNRVTCITKADRNSRYDGIIKLSGTRDDTGARWTLTRKECVDHVNKGTLFYVQASNHKVFLITGTSASGTEYVRTDPDQDTADNLLSLPECP
ncbi:DUF3892 domain-containing protein [Lentibacter sp. XHP0401]|uniref:DUF3892 domain-containing protein n=1 Tax=Lentibacter sp. XHP0401 TaxID=2984334 RepID=UPI003993E778